MTKGHRSGFGLKGFVNRNISCKFSVGCNSFCFKLNIWSMKNSSCKSSEGSDEASICSSCLYSPPLRSRGHAILLCFYQDFLGSAVWTTHLVSLSVLPPQGFSTKAAPYLLSYLSALAIFKGCCVCFKLQCRSDAAREHSECECHPHANDECLRGVFPGQGIQDPDQFY